MKHYITVLRLVASIIIIIILVKFGDTINYSLIGTVINYVPIIILLNYFSHLIEIDKAIEHKYIYLAICITSILSIRLPLYYGLILVLDSMLSIQLIMLGILIVFCSPILLNNPKKI